MLKQHDIFESSFVLSTFVSSLVISVHYVTGFLSVWYLINAVLVFCISVFVTFRVLRRLLDCTSPMNYKDILKYGPCKALGSWVPLGTLYPKSPASQRWKEYDTNEISIITTVLERRLISSWYPLYVSPDIGFPFACKELLDHAISKAFQITYKINTPSLYTDFCAILVSHINEYKRAEKLLQLSKESSFDQCYRLSHPIFQNEHGRKNKKKTEDHCANILRVLLKDLTPFELWDTPHSELVIRVLTKQVHEFIKETISDPKWINSQILEFINKLDKPPHIEQKVRETTMQTKDSLETLDPPLKNSDQAPSTIESVLTEVAAQTTAPILQNAISDIDSTETPAESRMEQVFNDKIVVQNGNVEVQGLPVMRQRRGRQGKNEVKIYDRIIEGSVQTWDTDEDLRCISVGQDLLAGLDGEISLSRLWEADGQDQEWSPNPQRKSPPTLWFGEEDAASSEAETPPRSANVRSDPVFHFPLHEIQSTVTQARHKIGDLQDEAAGMMEGILDFGMAGLRKGLRLTGLHEGNDEKHTSTTPVKAASVRTPSEHSPNKISPRKLGADAAARRVSPAEHSNEVTLANTNSSHLVKQQRLASQDSGPLTIPGRESPEPEYEEAADFASSIAKLRSLLQQHNAGDPWPNEEIVQWEGAEETRGRQESRHAHRHQYSATLAEEYDAIAGQQAEQAQGQSTNNMQRLDRLLQRTVTGVLNSIKTAVGGEGEESDGERTPPGDWQFVCTEHDFSMSGAISRLLASRRARTVDTAFDSLELAPKAFVPRHLDAAAPPVDIEEWSCTTGACWGSCAELAAAAGLWRSHLTHTALTVLLGELADDVIRSWLGEVGALLREQLFLAFGQLAGEEGVRQREHEPVDVAATAQAVVDKLPGALWVFGEATLRDSIQLLLRSLGSAKVNEDLAYRLLDVYALHFVRAASD